MVELPDRYIWTGEQLTGGYSTARVCIDSNLDRRVVVKELSHQSDKRRIRDEVSALSALRSKHVVEIYDVIGDPVSGEIAIVEDFVEGPDLEQIVTVREINNKELIRILYQLAAGLADIHDCGVVHRDIKPNNMRVSSEDILKIFDFGLARSAPELRTIGYHGTVGFSAPELFGRGEVKFTKAVDVYSFGCMAWFLVERGLNAAFYDRSTGKTVELPSIKTIADELPAHLASMIDGALQMDPRGRPSIGAIRDEIASVLLHDSHRALMRYGSEAQWLDANGRALKLTFGEIGSFTARYDGSKFHLANVTGDIFVNNDRATSGMELPGSCVIAMGARNLGWQREFVTFDMSHPEVVL